MTKIGCYAPIEPSIIDLYAKACFRAFRWLNSLKIVLLRGYLELRIKCYIFVFGIYIQMYINN